MKPRVITVSALVSCTWAEAFRVPRRESRLDWQGAAEDARTLHTLRRGLYPHKRHRGKGRPSYVTATRRLRAADLSPAPQRARPDDRTQAVGAMASSNSVRYSVCVVGAQPTATTRVGPEAMSSACSCRARMQSNTPHPWPARHWAESQTAAWSLLSGEGGRIRRLMPVICTQTAISSFPWDHAVAVGVCLVHRHGMQ